MKAIGLEKAGIRRPAQEDTREGIVSQEYTSVPSFIFRDRSVAVLEALVEYLYDTKKLSYHEIAMLLNRNDRTVWTVYRRAKLKRKGLIHHRPEKDE